MEWAKLLVAAAAIFTTVPIAIGGWVLQRQTELQTADKKTSALYVNPFLRRVKRPLRTNLQHFDAGWVRAQGEYARWTLFLILSILDGPES